MEWRNVKLGDVIKVGSGGTPSRSNNTYWSGGSISWLTIGDYKDFQTVTDTKEKITNEGLKNSSAKIFPKDTVVVSIFATLGRVGILGCEMTTNQAIAGIVPTKSIHSRYLMYAIKSNIQKVILEASGVAQKNINLTILKEFFIPLPFTDGKPDLAEQKRIADRLDLLFAETENGLSIFGKQRMRVRRIYQTVLSECFGSSISNEIEWKSLKFSDGLFKINTRTIDFKNIGDESVYLDIDAVKSGSIVNPKKVPKKNLPSRARRLIKEGDVLIASVRPYLKSFAVVPKEYEDCIASTGFFVIERNSNLEPRYIFHFAMSDLFINQTNALMQGGSYPALNKELMGQISIPIPFKNGKPDLTEQKRIADELEKVSMKSETLSSLFVKQGKAFSALRSSVLNQSFQMQT